MKHRAAAKAALILALAACAAKLYCLGSETPFPGLTADESSRLGRGETVVRPLGDWKRLALPSGAPGAAELAATVSSLKPNYLTEVLSILPASREAEIMARLGSALEAVGDYTKIPYYSTRWKKTFPLFDSVEILSRSAGPGGGSVDVKLSMDPFDPFPARYSWRQEGRSMAFSCENSGPISYHGVKAVQAGAMIWRLVLYRSGDSMVFYGIGAVKAFDMFGAIRDRLEPSFLGRTEAFFTYMLGRLK